MFDKIKNHYLATSEKETHFCEHLYQNKYFIIYLIIVLCHNMWFLGIDSFPVEGIAVSQCQTQTRTLDCSWDSWSLGSHYIAVCVWTIRRSSQQQSCSPNFLWCPLHLRIFFSNCKNDEWIRFLSLEILQFSKLEVSLSRSCPNASLEILSGIL